MSRVSVIMPAHNAGLTIEGSIRSVLAQTHREWELIVIDDGSDDDTADRVRAIAREDDRVRLVQNPTCEGVASARNRGVRESRYHWVAFLDSDDLWTADKLELQLKEAEQHPEVGLFFSSTEYIDEEGRSYGYVFHAPRLVKARDILQQNPISCSSVLVNKTLMLQHPMPAKKEIHEDLACWYSILSDTPYAVGIDLPLLRYRIRRGSKSGRKSRAVRMQWRTYRYLAIPLWFKLRFFLFYALRNLKKYRRIHTS